MSNVSGTNALKRVGVIKMLFLTLITLGLYLPYWIITRSRQIVDLTQGSELAVWLSYFVAVFFCMNYSPLLTKDIWSPLEPYNITLHVFSQLSSVCIIIWTIWLRGRWNEITGASKGGRLWSNLFFAVFFYAFYHQYKINQYLDAIASGIVSDDVDDQEVTGTVDRAELP